MNTNFISKKLMMIIITVDVINQNTEVNQETLTQVNLKVIT